MKCLKWVCVPMLGVALAVGLAACSSKEGTSPQAESKQQDQAQPADQAAQPSEEMGQSAESSSAMPEAPAVDQPQDAAQAPAVAPPAGEVGNPEVAEIMGTVLDSGGEIVVFTNQGNFSVAGEDLSDMVGKTVRVLGSLEESEGRRTIKVISVYEVK